MTDFRSIRQWRGSQDQAFEELCYQLRDPTPEKAILIKTGNPDGGLEWYVIHRNGVQWGWQAKFIFDIDSLLKNMEKSLKTVVDKRPNCRRLTFCIPFDLPDAPGGRERKSARQKFEDRKKQWRQRIPGACRVRVELWSEGELLQRLTDHPAQRGKAWFFWQKQVFSPDWCARRLAITTKAAGGRYSPELHIDLPVAFALEGLALSKAFWQKFRTRRGAVVKAVGQIDISHFTGIGVTRPLQRLTKAFAEWRREVPTCVELPKRLGQDRLLAISRDCRRAIYTAYPDQFGLDVPANIEKRSKHASERLSLLRHLLDVLARALRGFENILRSRAAEAAEHGTLLLTGEAGQGKTHLFCDAGERAVKADKPAVLLLAGRLSGRHVWTEIGEQLGLGPIGSEAIIDGMQAAAEAANAPFLLLLDALNEAAEPAAWQEELPSLLAEVARSPWISLGVSVRSTYLPVVLPSDGILGLPEVEHRGFQGREQEACEKFFDAFGLDQPQIPLLSPEFLNPLFLKLYCEGLKESGLSAPPKGEAHISDVFERYLKSKAARILSRLKLDPASRPVERAIDAFSDALVAANRDSLPRDRSTRLINAFAAKLHQWPETLLGQLLNEAVFTADVAWQSVETGYVEVIRFTYQRLADYRIGSILLKPLNCDPTQLSAALAPGKPLRETILKAPSGWIEALAVQLPERFGVELIDTARWRLKPTMRRQWDRAFVRSLAPRRASAVTERSLEILAQIEHQSRRFSEHVLETFLIIAPQPRHLLNANTLHDRLKRMPMPARDVRWSIPTYGAFDHGGALDRLIRWAARVPYADCSEEIVELVGVTLVWTFTSPNRRLRDAATKALARLLSRNLSVLLSIIKRFDGVDDPYVIERLAVGVTGRPRPSALWILWKSWP